jgi:xylulokinase
VVDRGDGAARRVSEAARSELVVGVDVGSTHVKSVVADLAGVVRAVARRPTPSRATTDGGTVHPVDRLVEAVESVVREAVAGSDDVAIRAVGIASVAEAGAPVDDRGRPLADVVAWFDPRPAAAARRLAEVVGGPELFARTGLRPDAKVTLAKLVWLRETSPDAVGAMAGWRFVADLLAQGWTGAVGTSATLACRSMAWDLRRAAWAPELLAEAGVRLDQMPPVIPWTEPVGRLGPAAAARLGLPAGLPVAVAGHDHVVGGLAAGVREPGDVLDSIGTAEALLLVTDAPMLSEEVRSSGFSVGAHVLPGRFTLIAALQTSGAFVDWMLTSVAGVPADAAPAERHARLTSLVGAARRGPSGIVARPTLRGRTAPSPDLGATASFEGLSLGDGLPELALAALEGTAFHVRWLEDELARLAGQPIARVRTIGGGAENDALLAIKAALRTAPLEVVEAPEAVALGAALVAAVAGGLASPQSIASRRVPLRAVGTPDPSVVAAYERTYRDRFLGASPRASA